MAVSDTPEKPVDLDQWFAAASRAAPAVGAIILVWSALETVMNQMTVAMRIQKAGVEKKPVEFRLSHKAKDRLNEWIKTVLPVAERVKEGPQFQGEFLRLKTVRDNLAHNIQAMWIDQTNQLRIMAMFDRKGYEKEAAAWLARTTARGSWEPTERHPSPYGSALYGDADILVAYEEMRQLLMFVNEVHSAPGLPRMRSARDEGLSPPHPHQ